MHIAQLSPEVRALVPDSPPPFAQVDAVLPTPSPHSGARRRLFFPSSSSPSPGAEGEDDDEAESNRAYVDRLLAEIAAEKARKWGFDFAQRKSPSLPSNFLFILLRSSLFVCGKY
jgi:hypothetical protein